MLSNLTNQDFAFITKPYLTQLKKQVQDHLLNISIKCPDFEFLPYKNCLSSLIEKCKFYSKSFLYAGKFTSKILNLKIEQEENSIYLSKFFASWPGEANKDTDKADKPEILEYYPGDLIQSQKIINMSNTYYLKNMLASEVTFNLPHNIIKTALSNYEIDLPDTINISQNEGKVGEFPDQDQETRPRDPVTPGDLSNSKKLIDELSNLKSIFNQIKSSEFIQKITKNLPLNILQKNFKRVAKFEHNLTKPIIWLDKASKDKINNQIFCSLLRTGVWIVCDGFSPNINFTSDPGARGQGLENLNFSRTESTLSENSHQTNYDHNSTRSNSTRVKYHKNLNDDTTISRNGLEVLSDLPVAIHRNSRIFILEDEEETSRTSADASVPVSPLLNLDLSNINNKSTEIKLLLDWLYQNKILNLNEIGLFLEKLFLNRDNLDEFLSRDLFVDQTLLAAEKYNDIKRKLFPKSYLPVFNYLGEVMEGFVNNLNDGCGLGLTNLSLQEESFMNSSLSGFNSSGNGSTGTAGRKSPTTFTEPQKEFYKKIITIINTKKINFSVDFIDRANLLVHAIYSGEKFINIHGPVKSGKKTLLFNVCDIFELHLYRVDNERNGYFGEGHDEDENKGKDGPNPNANANAQIYEVYGKDDINLGKIAVIALSTIPFKPRPNTLTNYIKCSRNPNEVKSIFRHNLKRFKHSLFIEKYFTHTANLQFFSKLGLAGVMKTTPTILMFRWLDWFERFLVYFGFEISSGEKGAEEGGYGDLLLGGFLVIPIVSADTQPDDKSYQGAQWTQMV